MTRRGERERGRLIEQEGENGERGVNERVKGSNAESFLMRLMLVLLALNVIAGAVYWLRKAHLDGEASVQAIHRDALRIASSGRLADAREMLLEIAPRAPGSVELYRDIAGIEYNMGLMREAASHLEKALELGETNEMAFTQLFFLRLFLGERAEATKLVRERIAPLAEEGKFPLDSLYHCQANALLEEAAFSGERGSSGIRDARALIGKLLAMEDRGRGETFSLAAEADWLDGDFASAEKSLKKAISHRIYPTSLKVDVLAALGQLSLEKGDEDAAKKYFHLLIAEIESWSEYIHFRLFPLREIAMMSLSLHYAEKFDEARVRAYFPVYDDLVRKGVVDHFLNGEIRENAVLVVRGVRDEAVLKEFIAKRERFQKVTSDSATPFNQCFYYRNLFIPLLFCNYTIVIAQCYEALGMEQQARKEYGELLRYNPREPFSAKRLPGRGGTR